jgi:2-(1,2-epoxy-1,2-dihydrophenyl)acetyl-CoA isomerase
MSDDLLVTEPRPGVAQVTLNRPAKRNALSARLMAELAATLERHGRDGTRCVVLTGAPPAFCAGGDLAELRDGDAAFYAAYCEAYRRIAQVIAAMDCPLIAAVNGSAVAGGFELMCLSDLRIASVDALIAAGDANLGLPTTSGLSWLLPRLVGIGRARAILYRDARMTGAEAHAIGLVEEAHPPGELLERALDVAAEIAGMPGDGIRLTRRTLNDALTQTHAEAIEAELVAQREAYRNPAVHQAIAAFFTR